MHSFNIVSIFYKFEQIKLHHRLIVIVKDERRTATPRRSVPHFLQTPNNDSSTANSWCKMSCYSHEQLGSGECFLKFKSAELWCMMKWWVEYHINIHDPIYSISSRPSHNTSNRPPLQDCQLPSQQLLHLIICRTHLPILKKKPTAATRKNNNYKIYIFYSYCDLITQYTTHYFISWENSSWHSTQILWE